jgi:hypothetical protein
LRIVVRNPRKAPLLGVLKFWGFPTPFIALNYMLSYGVIKYVVTVWSRHGSNHIKAFLKHGFVHLFLSFPLKSLGYRSFDFYSDFR